MIYPREKYIMYMILYTWYSILLSMSLCYYNKMTFYLSVGMGNFDKNNFLVLSISIGFKERLIKTFTLRFYLKDS